MVTINGEIKEVEPNDRIHDDDYMQAVHDYMWLENLVIKAMPDLSEGDRKLVEAKIYRLSGWAKARG